ncbi:sugar transferase [Corynebacterium nasicanis]|uniref:Sugar transferase n=1 Tax=Corynebacterium nasicanis TaxID=1448267 RepID=A0ABW1Q8D4_9CORY
MNIRRALFDITKRLADIAVSAVGLVVSAPVQLLVAGLIRARLGSPVLFRQPRPGRNGQVFELVKFRTMLPPSEDRQTDEERLTTFGQFLRSTSLDELPTLWNVLKGDMSLVGPRPLLVEYLEHYSPEQARRHEVRPGVTGLAQVRGRNQVPWERRFELDVEYVDNRSLALDLRILRDTLGTVLRRSGISEEGHVTMTPFADLGKKGE